MISIVVWKWPGSRTYTAEHVNVLARMVDRFYQKDHRFVCVTAEPEGLDPSIRVVHPPQLPRLEELTSLHGSRFPSCYRRLWNFSIDAGEAFGDRFFCVDIDTVITADLSPILDRPEEFVVWSDRGMTFAKYAGGAYLMTAGARRQVWETFDPDRSPAIARAAGFNGSDQAWISYCLYPREATYDRTHGMYSTAPWCIKPRAKELPDGVRMIHFPGGKKPWQYSARRRWPWLVQHYWEFVAS
jgi:hypothetical protein